MLCFLEEITKRLDEGSPVNIVYLYFQKAFGKVPHQRLLLQLKAHGIGDSIIDCIEQSINDVVENITSNVPKFAQMCLENLPMRVINYIYKRYLQKI